jgi:E3 ubiquitin-protein ligase BRE1
MLQIEKLQKEKQELHIVLDMYGQEGYDNRYILLRV